jgi:hypothetical protein
VPSFFKIEPARAGHGLKFQSETLVARGATVSQRCRPDARDDTRHKRLADQAMTGCAEAQRNGGIDERDAAGAVEPEDDIILAIQQVAIASFSFVDLPVDVFKLFGDALDGAHRTQPETAGKAARWVKTAGYLNGHCVAFDLSHQWRGNHMALEKCLQ